MFSEARKEQDDVYFVTAAWVDGYITGVNQYAAGTYDISPFESTELLMAIVDHHRLEHPNFLGETESAHLLALSCDTV